MFVPQIATWFPAHLNAQSQAVETEQIDDSMNRLEEDPYKAGMEQQEKEEGQGQPEDPQSKPPTK